MEEITNGQHRHQHHNISFHPSFTSLPLRNPNSSHSSSPLLLFLGLDPPPSLSPIPSIRFSPPSASLLFVSLRLPLCYFFFCLEQVKFNEGEESDFLPLL